MSLTTDEDLIEQNVSAVCRAVLDDATETVLAMGFSADGVEELLDVLGDHDDPPAVRLLVTEPVLKTVTSDFTVAGTAADLVTADVLSLRTTEGRLDGPLLCTDEAIVSVVAADGRAAGLVTRDEEFVATARSQYTERWEAADAFRLRTPPLDRVRETLDDEFGPDLRADFERMRTALGEERGTSDVDEVVISLLAAAKNEQLLYDISTWGENTGLASRATFSRKKATLEEHGLIDTEKVPIDVGRPRLRLLLGDERLHEADTDELVGVAQSMLSTASS
ncbi:transcriptional regulator TbsP [Halococcus saccharolyticus]|uniref:Transcriptional regulator n=1 Tax=Halococcus saccharolyticus DSM 5350 TaxID=1227455 RepID=M0MIC1_9EURY|nr:DUF5821 family protein [Halococcus saccharolyticus]EMA45436.1 hypothetical protein C449_07425 [Halococcus saccharolyticus DSM 5350]